MSPDLREAPSGRGIDPVSVSRWAFRNGPWVLIALVVHAVLLAILSVIYIAHQRRQADLGATELAIARAVEEPPTAPPEPEKRIIDFERVPQLLEPDREPSERAKDPFLPIGQELPAEEVHPDGVVNDLRGDPTAIDDLLPGDTTGGTPIGTGGPGRHATGAPDDRSGPLRGPRRGHPDGGLPRTTRGSGPTRQTEESLAGALEWLRKHQDVDGRWDSDGFSKNCKLNTCDGPGEGVHDVGVTGIALLAFLGDGNTLQVGPYRAVVARSVKWLISQQDRDSGLIGEKAGTGFLYCHSIATLALCEAYFLSNKPSVLKEPAQRAVNLILNARNPYKVWRYQVPPNGDNDTSVTGWMVFALKSAEEAGLSIDKNAFDAALLWFDEMTDPQSGRCGYQQKGEASARRTGTEVRFPPDKTESLTAVALLCRFFLGQSPEKNPVMRLHAARLRKTLPVWEVTPERCLIDEYYWYYGTFAMFQMGGDDWKVWNNAMKAAVVDHQRQEGDEKGSWDPIGAWGKDGGRVYMTAIGALCLEVYYRYARILGAR